MTKILIVDDTPTDQMLVQRLLEKNPDLHAICASNGKEAMAVIAREDPDIVLTDLQMPEMDGLQLVKRIRREHAGIPVILMTAFGSEDIAIQALHHGAANYVPKKNLARDLLESVESVLAAATDLRMQQRLFASMQQTHADFILENDIALIPPLINFLKLNLARRRFLDETSLIRVTVALREALMNAIIHGNLQVSSELRDNDLDAYYCMIETRRKQSPFMERHVQVHAAETADEARYVIRDEGVGFDPLNVPDPTHPDNMEKAHGRGLLLIRTFMDEFAHNAKGNEITMVKRRDKNGAP
jgi:CheY-like chemotaxis protein/anti-sigma regulatory factor (Ser/Thr protein kinase)